MHSKKKMIGGLRSNMTEFTSLVSPIPQHTRLSFAANFLLHGSHAINEYSGTCSFPQTSCFHSTAHCRSSK
ncbi:unnamed protein product [Coffea canephora]|uniref:Uncharacterized protein n=1 Tax=Coffea canephora TaxID=49390 RepID=A0A068UWE6_COFCA|nr:unnamed protein product [Coffea canephora]